MVLTRGALGPELDWLPDDTEESLLGTSIHQMVIVALDNCFDRIRRLRGLPWFIGNQLKLLIPRQGKGTYQPSPDITVHPTLGDARLPSLGTARYGPPALAIEVASPATARKHDLDTLNPRAKPLAYAQAGIAEYLFYDPLEDFVPGRVRAWRLGARGVYEPWEAAQDGRWHSALGISFAPEEGGILLRIYDQDGNLVPTSAEMDDERAKLDALLIAERERGAAQDALLAALRSERDALLAVERERSAENEALLAAERERTAALEAELRRLRGN